MKPVLNILLVFVLMGTVAFWALTNANTTDPEILTGLTGDPEQGKAIFSAAGCASCHAAKGATGDGRLSLGGGQAFASDFGTFYAPNISSDPDAGIGDWQAIDLLNAMQNGTSPSGQHLYPAFPYTSYVRASPGDIVSLLAYLQTLPQVATVSKNHDLKFPFGFRRVLGIWKILFLHDDWVLQTAATPQIERGRYLVEALGHCGECHTPRNLLGGLQVSRWLGGGPNPSGKGTIPNITPGALDWSDPDLVNYFKTGFTPDYDTAGGEMAEVVENLSNLPPEDLDAIVAYLRAVPAIKPTLPE